MTSACMCLRGLALAPVVLLSQFVWGTDLEVLPERATPVTMSNRDVNRIHCPLGVNDVTWSQEKPVKVEQKPENVMVKFLVRRVGATETRVSEPVDLHITCGGEVYTLIVYPRDVDTQTIRLGDARRRELQAIAREWGTIPIEDQIKRLTLAVFRNQLPEGFERRAIPQGDRRRNVEIFDNASVVGQSEVLAPAIGLRAVEYVVVAHEGMTLQERDFLSRDFGDIVALTLDPLVVPKDGAARLIVVERSKSDEAQ